MRRRKRANLPRISTEQARQALHILVHDGRIAAREVAQALERRKKLIGELRERLAALGEGVSAAMARAAKGASFPKLTAQQKHALRRRGVRTVSAAQRAARQAQGRYMAAVRRLSKASRTKIKAVRKSSGVNAAIAAAKKLAR